MNDYDDDYEEQELRYESRAAKAWAARWLAHSDPRDPDYPGHPDDEEEDE